MDEILIEDKKYVSSKLAAKMTGYAKDYVGQLCREGRVPARLVGRGWYVLESAIQDHRFGNPGESKNTEKIEEAVPTISKTWEFPRYEAARAEILPSINRMSEKTPPPALVEELEDDEEVAPEAPQSIHDSWREWFDHVGVPPIEKAVETVEEPILPTITAADEVIPQKEEPVKDSEINVPLRVVSEYFPEKEIYLKEAQVQEKSAPQEIRRERAHSNVLTRSMQTGAVLIAGISAVIAIIGTGYFDSYIISNSRGGTVSGISVYRR